MLRNGVERCNGCNQDRRGCNPVFKSSDILFKRRHALVETIESDSEPATQHAFWKGQGDPYTIRKAQGHNLVNIIMYFTISFLALIE